MPLENISFADKSDSNEPSLMDGLKTLIGNSKGNLGWRIVLKYFLPEEDFQNLLKETKGDDSKQICDLVDTKLKKEINGIVQIMRNVNNDKDIDDEKLKEVLEKISLSQSEIAKSFLKDELAKSSSKKGNPAIRKIPIKVTTRESSKGLSADYVFITHFDDQFFIKNKDNKTITDQDVCNFLVALTRAKNKVFLVSSQTNEPTFLKWIDQNRIEKI